MSMGAGQAPKNIPYREADRYRGYRDLTVVYEGSSEPLPVKVPDLSATGMFINTSKHFPEGAVLKLNFFLMRSNYEINCRGEVRYCLPGVGIGVQFVDIPRDAQEAIEQELNDQVRA